MNDLEKKKETDRIWHEYILPALGFSENRPPPDTLAVLKTLNRKDFVGYKLPKEGFKEFATEHYWENKAAQKTYLDDQLFFFADDEYRNGVLAALLAGAKINAKDRDGNTALHEAAGNGNADVVALLLEHGANVNAKNHRRVAALHWAAEWGNADMVALLLEHGAKINAKANSGKTALHYAVEDGFADNVGVIALLLEHGAKINAKANDGATALQLAQNHGFTHKIALLKAAKTYQTQSSTLPPKAAYPTLLFGAKAGLNSAALTAALAKQEKLFTARHQGTYPPHKAYNMLNPPPSFVEYATAPLKNMGTEAYTGVNNVMDMVGEIADAIILPQIAPKSAANLDDEAIESLQEKATQIAAEKLLSTMTLPEIFALSDEWHRNKAIPTKIRNLKSGDWQPLMERFEHNNSYIIPLTSVEMLDDETHQLKHCVGEGNYDQPCLNGKGHILSVRDKATGNSLATICVDANLEIQRNQFYGRGNSQPPEEAKAAFAALKQAVTEETFKLNTPHHGAWGETERSKQAREESGVSEIERVIGYKLNERGTKLKQCIDHYKNIKQKTDVARTDRRETLAHQERAWVERIATPFPLPDFMLSPPTRGRGVK